MKDFIPFHAFIAGEIFLYKNIYKNDIETWIAKLEIEYTPETYNLKQQLKQELNKAEETDPYAITYSSNNSIQFRDNTVNFPFDCYSIANLLAQLREKVLSKTVCATDLQNYPLLIFEETKLKDHPDLAGWIYNIIYTWINELRPLHQNKKKLFV